MISALPGLPFQHTHTHTHTHTPAHTRTHAEETHGRVLGGDPAVFMGIS